jgi:hypothetical protein
MSLSAVKKKVQGVVGREQPTGHTLFKSWDQLEQAMNLIWKNARDYNEDGSEIYNVSIELEVGNCRQSARNVLTGPGILLQAPRRSQGQGRRTTTAKAQAQHVDLNAGSQAAAKIEAPTEPRFRSQYSRCT